MLKFEDLTRFGRDLSRPESVVIGRDGSVYTSHRAAGVSRIAPDGNVTCIGNTLEICGSAFVPNGIALLPGGDILIANIGDAGGLWRLENTGKLHPYCTEMNGKRMPPVNFVLVDDEGEVWFSVSTRHSPRHLAYRRDIADGFVARIVNDEAVIEVDGLCYTNEFRFADKGKTLYINETFGQSVRRFRRRGSSGWDDGEVFAQLPQGSFVDGLEIDAEGCLWVVCIVSNRLYRISPLGVPQLLLEEADTDWLAEVDLAMRSGKMGRHHFDHNPSKVLRNISSVTFGGPDGATGYLGCLLADHLLTFRWPRRLARLESDAGLR